MNLVVKKRLVGTAVLLLIAAIVWPWLFDFDQAASPESANWEQATQAIDNEIERLRAETSDIKNEILGSDSQDGDDGKSDGSKGLADASLEDAIENHPRLEIPSSEAELRGAAGTGSQRADGDSTAVLDENKIPISWVVQIATFTRWENADQLNQQLLQDGYRSFLRPAQSSQPPPYVLMVGPQFDRDATEALASEVSSKYRTGDPLVRRFRSGSR